MLMTAEQLKSFIATTETNKSIKLRLSSIETMIRSYTNNNFQVKSIRYEGFISDNKITLESTPKGLNKGDTIELSYSKYNNGLYVIESIDDKIVTFDGNLIDEPMSVMITKVVYPKDVILGTVNLMKWELNNRDKVGISSETISRHTVSYFNMDGDNSLMGYPKSLLGFLKPYRKARF